MRFYPSWCHGRGQDGVFLLPGTVQFNLALFSITDRIPSRWRGSAVIQCSVWCRGMIHNFTVCLFHYTDPADMLNEFTRGFYFRGVLDMSWKWSKQSSAAELSSSQRSLKKKIQTSSVVFLLAVICVAYCFPDKFVEQGSVSCEAVELSPPTGVDFLISLQCFHIKIY